MFAEIDLLEAIYRSPVTDITRGVRKADRIPVVVKTVAASSDAQARLRYEYRILQSVAALQCAQIVRPLELVEAQGRLGIVFEDIDAVSVRVAHAAQPLSLLETLHVGVETAQALAAVHKGRLVHKDVNPNNIIINRFSGRIQLIDFGIASQLRHEKQAGDSLRRFEGTPAYMSPEQTGRTHTSLGYHTDLYSLGATLFELATGTLPFAQTDMADLIYAILTSRPPDLSRSAVPPGLAAVLQRLLEKEPDKRYQSAYGLAVDLQHCHAAWQESHGIAFFALGQSDRVERFELPEKLYGRAGEVGQLQDAFAACQRDKQARLLLISGPSGIGKSSLMDALRPELLKARALYAAGKHDQLHRHMPLGAFGQAIAQLVRQFVKEPDDERHAWARRIQGAVGRAGQALVDVIPDLELILGKQAAVPVLGPKENENRLLMLLQHLLQVLCKQQPLVLFLDDLQWADSATFHLLQVIAHEAHTLPGLFLVGAYRKNEVEATHPLRATLQKISESGHSVRVIEPAPLALADVSQMLQDATRASAGEVQTLAQLLWSKTDGNPFFLRELMNYLWDETLLTFDGARGTFAWNLDAITSAGIPDNVVNLVTDKMGSLQDAERHVLKVAACMGDRFGLHLLAEVLQKAPQAVAQQLDGALQSGLVVPLAGAYRYAGEQGSAETNIEYKFAHDRVQEAAYELLTADEAARQHHAIAQLLIAKWHHDSHDIDIFAVVEHCNAGLTCVREATQKRQICQLNVTAADEAKRSAAYSVARGYFAVALTLLPDPVPAADRKLLWTIQLGLAESEFLAGDDAAALQRLNRVDALSETPAEQAEAHVMRIVIHDTLARYTEAIAAMLAGLRAIHVSFTLAKRAHIPRLLVQMVRRGANLEALRNAPPCTNELAMLECSLLVAAGSSCFQGATVLEHLSLTMRVAQLCIQYGRNRFSAFCYASLCIVLRGIKRYDLAHAYAELARDCMSEPDVHIPAAAVLMTLAWSRYLHLTAAEGEADARFGFLIGRDAGDINFAGWNAATQITYRWRSSLGTVEELCDECASGTIAASAIISAKSVRQAARCMLGLTRSPTSLADDDKNKDIDAEFAKYITEHATRDSGSVFIRVFQMTIAYIHGDIDKAVAQFKDLLKYNVYNATSDYGVFIAYLYGGLSLLADARRGHDDRFFRASIKRVLAHFKLLAKVPPHTYRGDGLLIEAELAALDGHPQKAASLYDAACLALAHSGCVDSHAMALERAGEFYKSCGQHVTAVALLERALDVYVQWGATLKVGMLEQALAEYAERVGVQQLHRGAAVLQAGGTRTTVTGNSAVTSLDFATLMRVSQAIASEVAVDRVLQNFVEGLKHLAGATRTVLLMHAADGFVVRVDTHPAAQVPHNVINYVARVKEPVVIHDVTKPEVEDAYFADTHAKAAACIPVSHQGEVKAIVYLENDVVVGTFGHERLGLIMLLAGQTAVALDNARIYAHIEDELAKRTAEANKAHELLLKSEKENTEVQMAGGFAHEMRNILGASAYPMALIAATPDYPASEIEPLHAENQRILQALRQGEVPADLRTQLDQLDSNNDFMRSLLEGIAHNIARGQSITQRILDYARASGIVPDGETIDLHDVVDAVLQEYAAELGRSSIAVSSDIPSGSYTQMRAAHAEAIVRNLLANAKEACAEAEAPQSSKRIDVRLAKGESTHVLTVADTGSGMTPEVSQNVFKPFFTTKGALGTGLGLAFSRKIAGVYGAQMEFVSTQKVGTTFTVKLPAAHKEPA